MNKQTLGKFDQNASLKKGIVVCLLAAALLVSMVGMASANSTTWDLDSQNIATGVYEMERTGGPGDDGQSGSVTISASSSVIWRADEATSCNVGYPATTWNGRLTQTTTTDYTVDIGYCDADGANYVPNGGTLGSHDYFSGGGSYFHQEVNAFTIPQGKYLALKVITASTGMTVDTDETSFLTYPPLEPQYPVPELPTIILMSTGLLALAGFVLYSRSRRRNGKSQ